MIWCDFCWFFVLFCRATYHITGYNITQHAINSTPHKTKQIDDRTAQHNTAQDTSHHV